MNVFITFILLFTFFTILKYCKCFVKNMCIQLLFMYLFNYTFFGGFYMKKSKYCLLVAFLFPLIGCSNNNSSTSSSLDSSSKLSEVVSSSTSSSSSSSTSSSAAEKNKHLIITKAATNNYVSSYFVELYNPTDTTINLSSYSLQYLPIKSNLVKVVTLSSLGGKYCKE